MVFTVMPDERFFETHPVVDDPMTGYKDVPITTQEWYAPRVG